MTYVDAATRQESNTALGIRRLIFTEELKLVVLVFVVSDVTVTDRCC